MMTDKQQIEDISKIVSTDCIIKDKEQMARIIAFDLCKQSYHSDWYGNEAQCYSDNNFHDCKKIKAVVDKLYNAGYRKVPENAVVLTREEHKQMFKDLIASNKVIEAETRKETAKEIIATVKSCMQDFEDDDDGYILKKCEFEFFMRELAKQLGIEVG